MPKPKPLQAPLKAKPSVVASPPLALKDKALPPPPQVPIPPFPTEKVKRARYESWLRQEVSDAFEEEMDARDDAGGGKGAAGSYNGESLRNFGSESNFEGLYAFCDGIKAKPASFESQRTSPGAFIFSSRPLLSAFCPFCKADAQSFPLSLSSSPSISFPQASSPSSPPDDAKLERTTDEERKRELFLSSFGLNVLAAQAHDSPLLSTFISPQLGLAPRWSAKGSTAARS